MSTRETVDVVIPTYNDLEYLPEAVESVLAQTYEDVTLHVVDDGSTDGTENYVRAISDPRVRYLRKENGGQASARNLGIRASVSPYIAFLDADDLWYPNKLERQLDLIRRDDRLGLVHAYQHKIDERGAVIGTAEYDLRGMVFDRLLDGNFVSGSGSMVLVRREVFDRLGLFREDFLIGEDWDMWLRLSTVYAIDYVPDYLAALRVRGDSLHLNYRMMADGFVHMFPTMAASLELDRHRRARLADAVLGRAAAAYAEGGMNRRAAATMAQLFREDPRAVLDASRLRFAAGVSLRALGLR
ncbi:MAG TPA: glycosyltransferase family 2 protein [Gaiellaceae bacterium]|nr:glycosyltransferase family 2 protein [Gaiellaceae bacterium]